MSTIKHANRSAGATFRRLFAAALIVGALSAGTAPTKAEEPTPDKRTAKYEIEFMTGMVDHHAMAVMMAEVCVARATHEGLRTRCQNIIATQTQESR